MNERISLMYPGEERPEYRKLPEISAHDLALDELCKLVAEKQTERAVIYNYLTNITNDPTVAEYRIGVFEDILRLPQIRDRMSQILERVDFLRQFGSFNKDPDASGVWDIIHRMEDMYDYIEAVEAIYETLSSVDIKSEGLTALREYARKLYEDSGFSELKKDIAEVKKYFSEVKSVTLGVNLNDRYEPNSVGIISVNSQKFTKSPLVSNFSDFLTTGDHISEKAGWDGSFRYRPGEKGEATQSDKALIAMTGNPFASMALLLPEDHGDDMMRSMDRIMAHMLNKIAGKLRSLTRKYTHVSTAVITGLIPEFMYYIRFAEYVEKLEAAGFKLCTATVLPSEGRRLNASGIYNLKLANEIIKPEDERTADNIIGNDLDFSDDHRVYILTGANRGGKTTFTQAVGLSFILAQSGIRVPAGSFAFAPVDNVYTHYPADEAKTLDLGRLGEETKRFREIYQEATPDSLILLNESFSTTSFEEGYYIAKDVVRALLHKGMRTIYNTHMHKLAEEAESISKAEGTSDQAVSLLAETRDGERIFRIHIAPPEGSSYAHDIAERYGVTYEQLMEGSSECSSR